MQDTEQDIRLNMLNSLLTTPHRDLAKVHGVHQELVKQDPLFYGRLAAWYADPKGGHAEIRDHVESFIISLALSNFDGHRDEACALMRDLPPYQLCRVVDFIHGRKDTQVVRAKKAKVAAGAEAEKPKPETKVIDYGLFKNVPNSIRTEVTRYLREREADDDWFDATALSARKQLKRLYSVLHIKPGERAQKILFDREPPEGSKLAQLKALAKLTDPGEQAVLIAEQKIPYRVASTVITQMTPAVILALVEVMSSQELLNNLASLKKRGALDNPDIKARIDAKIGEAKKSKRVSALKMSKAVEAGALEGATKAAVEEVADAQLKAKGRIKRPIALLIDRSGSMSVSIEIGKRIAAMVSAIMDAPLFVYAFDKVPMEVTAKGTSLADWEAAFKGIKPHGGTSCGSPLLALERAKQRVETLLYVSDGGDNNHPLFQAQYPKYCAALAIQPNVVLVKLPGDQDTLSRQCESGGINLDVWDVPAGDMYSFPGLLPLLTRPSKLDLLMDILRWEVPKRRAA